MFAEDLADEQKAASRVITRRKTRKLIQCGIGFASRYEQSACWQADRVLNNVPFPPAVVGAWRSSGEMRTHCRHQILKGSSACIIANGVRLPLTVTAIYLEHDHRCMVASGA